MHALRAQAVAARSYALSEGRSSPSGKRYSYAKTCDSQACQVYGGSAVRANPGAASSPREVSTTTNAVNETAGVIRRWPNGTVVSTEFSSSNGPRTAGGAFPPVDDPADDIRENALHRWVRVIDATALESRYGLGNLVAAGTQRHPTTTFDGIWGGQVVLQGTTGSASMVNWDFRQAYGLPSPGFTLRAVTRDTVTGQDLAFIGDSVGVGATNNGELQALLNGVFSTVHVDALGSRRTVGGGVQPDGLAAAQAIPEGTDVAIVELGYNDSSNYAANIDQVMGALRAKGVQRVAWVNLSTRRTSAPGFAQFNEALAAAQARWPELQVLDWNAASSGQPCDRWYQNDGVHLTSTGDVGLAMFLRTAMLSLPSEGCGKLGAGSYMRVRVTGVGGVPATGVTAVALNVTAVDPAAWGFFTLWPCGSARPADASHVNYIEPGAVEPNAVLAPVDETGEICLWTYSASHVLVDVNGWFTGGFEGRNPSRIVDTRSGFGAPAGRLPAGQVLRVKVSGEGGVPPSGVTAVALNVTAVETAGWGFFTVWPCASDMPVASHVNFVRSGLVEPNSVLMPVDATGEVCIWTYADAHVLVDVNGWFTSGFTGQAPVRIVDTRSGQGAPQGRLGAGQVLEVPVSGVANVPASGVTAVALNVTAVETAGWGFFTVWPCNSPMPPDASHVNFIRPGAVEPNSVLAPVDASGKVCIWTFADAHVLVDVNGWFTEGYQGQAPRRFVDTRSGQTTPR
jgi:lysophospholipase L1-like esterase